MKSKFENDFKKMEIIGEILDIKSTLKAEDINTIETFTDEIINSLKN